jgi:hypothetical protein
VYVFATGGEGFAAALREVVSDRGGEIVAEEYFPLDHMEQPAHAWLSIGHPSQRGAR